MAAVALWLAMLLDETTVAAAVARARAATRIDTPCREGAAPDEIVVCAARNADRYRVPLVTGPAPGDPRAVDALGERERLLVVPQLPCGVGAFLQGCGSVGVSASTRGGVKPGTQRPLAK